MLWHGWVHILVYNNLYLLTSFTKATAVMKLHRVKTLPVHFNEMKTDVDWAVRWNSDFICPFHYSVGVCSVILRDRFHTAGNQLQSHQYESETTDDQHYPPLLLFTLRLAEEQRFFEGESFVLKGMTTSVWISAGCFSTEWNNAHSEGVQHVRGRVGTLRDYVK